MKFDLHVHSKYSKKCGYMETKDIVRVAMFRGLQGVAVTDHDTIKGGLKAKEYESVDFKVIIGSEIMTDRGEIIGFFLSDEIQSRDFEGAVEEIRDQDGIVIVPHPFDSFRKSALHPTEKDLKFIDGVEGFNSRCISQRSNKDAFEFGMQNELLVTAGSDAHFVNEIGKAGIFTSGEDLRESILSGDFETFGMRSGFHNHVFTKGLKTWRKIKQF